MACLSLSSIAQADLIVDWGGSSVSTDQVFSNKTDNNIGGFSGGDPLQISPTTGYTGGTFYGQVAWTTAGQDGSYGAVDDSGGTDRIEIKRYDTDLRAVVLWKQADFLNGLNTGNVGFDATSTVSATIATYVNFDPGRVVIRLQGGTHDGYYISSEAPFNAGNNAVKSADLTSLTWLAYDPATSLTTFGSPVSLVSGGIIDHVTEVGFYARSQNATSANAFRVSSFEVSASPVPEPASLTLLGAGAWIIFSRYRK